jgi:hypothetical protein
MVGFVGGDVGTGTYAGEILNISSVAILQVSRPFITLTAESIALLLTSSLPGTLHWALP